MRWAHNHKATRRRNIVGIVARVALWTSPGGSFVDLGANIGTFSCTAAASGRLPWAALRGDAPECVAAACGASVCALGAPTSARIFVPIALGSRSGESACMQAVNAFNSGAAAAMPDDGPPGCAMGARVCPSRRSTRSSTVGAPAAASP